MFSAAVQYFFSIVKFWSSFRLVGLLKWNFENKSLESPQQLHFEWINFVFTNHTFIIVHRQGNFVFLCKFDVFETLLHSFSLVVLFLKTNMFYNLKLYRFIYKIRFNPFAVFSLFLSSPSSEIIFRIFLFLLVKYSWIFVKIWGVEFCF